MASKVFLKYPCGKLFELRIPIATNSDINKPISYVLPGEDKYFEHAKKKFEINNLKVIEYDIPGASMPVTAFISLAKKMRCLD